MVIANPTCSKLPTRFLSADEPITGLTATNDGPTVLGSLTTLTATIDTGTNVIFTWDFGDGSSGSGMVATHEYASYGVFIATVTATNSE